MALTWTFGALRACLRPRRLGAIVPAGSCRKHICYALNWGSAQVSSSRDLCLNCCLARLFPTDGYRTRNRGYVSR
jgi:hypothetical protein